MVSIQIQLQICSNELPLPLLQAQAGLIRRFPCLSSVSHLLPSHHPSSIICQRNQVPSYWSLPEAYDACENTQKPKSLHAGATGLDVLLGPLNWSYRINSEAHSTVNLSNRCSNGLAQFSGLTNLVSWCGPDSMSAYTMSCACLTHAINPHADS